MPLKRSIAEQLSRNLYAALTIVEDSLPAEPQRTTIVTPKDVRAIIRARRARAKFFREDLFAEPAWDMLLELYANDLTQHRVSVTSLCIASAVPATTALRWINTLLAESLILRSADPLDGRRFFVTLSDKGRTAMDQYFSVLERVNTGT